MSFSRVWSMPSKDTFEMKPIDRLLRSYIKPGMVVIDPFARNSTFAPKYSNDFNPSTKARYHMEATDFLDMLIAKKLRADIILIDPPYSPHQMKHLYAKMNTKIPQKYTPGISNAALYSQVKKRADKLLKNDGLVICFGWNSIGMGSAYKREHTMMVYHGGAHNDTIVTVDRKAARQKS